MESLDDDGLDVIISTVMISDVSCDVCVEPDQLPVVVSKEALEPLAFPVVALTRSQVGCTPIVAWPANDAMILQVRAASFPCGHSDKITGWLYTNCCLACE